MTQKVEEQKICKVSCILFFTYMFHEKRPKKTFPDGVENNACLLVFAFFCVIARKKFNIINFISLQIQNLFSIPKIDG